VLSALPFVFFLVLGSKDITNIFEKTRKYEFVVFCAGAGARFFLFRDYGWRFQLLVLFFFPWYSGMELRYGLNLFWFDPLVPRGLLFSCCSPAMFGVDSRSRDR
jgi:hypothetical protein